MKNYFKKTIGLMIILFAMTGCFKRDDLEGVDIYTTVYPIQFVTDYLYGYNSNVSSIYPAEANVEEYTLTDKKIKEYSEGAIFIYNGISNEKGIARDLLNANKNLKIIDVSQGLEYNNSIEELWINPSDFLMLAHNIKNGLEEYISNKYIIEEINKNYEDLKILISSYDAELENVPGNTSEKNLNIIVANSSLKFLSKYGFNIIDLDESQGEIPAQTKRRAKELINDKTVKYIYMLDNDPETETVKEMVAAGAEIKKLRSMTILTEEDIQNGVTYKNMMRDNIEAIKAEAFETK